MVQQGRGVGHRGGSVGGVSQRRYALDNWCSCIGGVGNGSSSSIGSHWSSGSVGGNWSSSSVSGHSGSSSVQSGLHHRRNHILNDGSAVHLGQTLVGDSCGHTLHHGANLGQGGFLHDGGGGCAVDQRSSGQVSRAGSSHSQESRQNELQNGERVGSVRRASVIRVQLDTHQFEHVEDWSWLAVPVL